MRFKKLVQLLVVVLLFAPASTLACKNDGCGGCNKKESCGCAASGKPTNEKDGGACCSGKEHDGGNCRGSYGGAPASKEGEEAKKSRAGGEVAEPAAGFIDNPAADAEYRLMREDTDGKLGDDEFRVISSNGSITRRPCPYSCRMRGIESSACKEWRSLDGKECYVQNLAQDRAHPSQAIPLKK